MPKTTPIRTKATTIITALRDAAARDTTPAGLQLRERLGAMSDDQVARLMFANWRKASERGLRLTNFGLTMMKGYFQSYEVGMPEGYLRLTPAIIYLENCVALPYHCADRTLTVFEAELAFKLSMVDGDLSILMTNEPVSR